MAAGELVFRAEADEDEVGVGSDVPGGERETLHGTFQDRLVLWGYRVVEDFLD